MIERTWGKAGDGARESASCADRSIGRFAVRGGGIGCRTPDYSMLGRIGHAQNSDIAVPCGRGCPCNSVLPGGHCRLQESSEGDITTV